MEWTVDTTMQALMDALPGARRALFARYHLGGCQSCAFSPTETLAQLAQRSDLDADEMLKHLLESHEHDRELWLTPTDAKQAENLLWIDIRTREEFEAVPIPGARFFTQELQQELFAGDPATRILLFDHSGKHVLDQVAWFRGHGLNHTWGLLGGIDAWSQEIDPNIPRYRLEFDD